MISVGLREINEPRKYGIAQNEQRRSQPEAIFSGAHGALPKRLRKSEPPAPSEDAYDSSIASWRAAGRSAGAIGRSDLRSRGTCGVCAFPETIDCKRAEISW